MTDAPTPRTGLPRVPVSLVRAAAPWKRSAGATTTLPDAESVVAAWRPPAEKLASYRQLLGSAATVPIAFPQVPVMALHMDLISSLSFPIKAMGLIHLSSVVEAVADLPAEGPWTVRAWVAGGRHVKSGLEFDLCGEVIVDGQVAWRSTAVTLSRSASASGAEESTVPELADEGPWESEQVLSAEEGVGRAFGRVTGDVNPIHLHKLPAKAFGFRRAIAHGWWITGRAAAALDRDESVPGRTLEIAFRRPVELPSQPLLRSRLAEGAVEFAVMPGSSLAPRADGRPLRALTAGRITG